MKYQLTKGIAATAIGLLTSTSTVFADPIDLKFFFHLDAGMTEQDVYAEKTDGKIHRVSAADTDLTVPLYGTTETVHHNPFDTTTDGPYDKGAELPVTLGEWLAASGQGTYECHGETSTISIEFDNLVPDGLYTMWHFFMSMPANQPFGGTIDVPYGPRDGSKAAFSANGEGVAVFQTTTNGCLQYSGEQLAAGLAIAYHSDGKVHGGQPGDFSLNTHVQLFTMLSK